MSKSENETNKIDPVKEQPIIKEKSVLENKKESIYPGMSLVETLLNMKILDEWLND